MLRTDRYDLRSLRLRPGEGRSLTLSVAPERLTLGGQAYDVGPEPLATTVDVSRMSGGGYALRLRFGATVQGPCMRCLEPAAIERQIDAREVFQPDPVQAPGAGDELISPYVDTGELDLHGWARDALALSLPAKLLCRPGCAGLCPVCGVDLNRAGPGHGHERPADPRWAKLSEISFE